MPDRSNVHYRDVIVDVANIVDAARDNAARSVNAAMTAAYWLIGRRIVEFEQSGEERAEYGTALIERLSADLTQRFGRGFSRQNIQNMRVFYLAYPPNQIRQTPSGISSTTTQNPIRQTPSGESDIAPTSADIRELTSAFPIPGPLQNVRVSPAKKYEIQGEMSEG